MQQLCKLLKKNPQKTIVMKIIVFSDKILKILYLLYYDRKVVTTKFWILQNEIKNSFKINL